jgi:hypothetical protein
MTVTELIERLRSYPQDAEIVVGNNDLYINGVYYATDVEDYTENTVLISTDHDYILEER